MFEKIEKLKNNILVAVIKYFGKYKKTKISHKLNEANKRKCKN